MSKYSSRWGASVLLLLAALVVGSAGPASAAVADPGGDADPGASAVQATRDPVMWWIKNNGLAVGNGAFNLNLMQVPANVNPLLIKVLWHFTPVPGKPATYYVENHNGGCLDIADGISTAPGFGLDVNACDQTRSQQWHTPGESGGFYRMTNDWSGLAATVTSRAAGATLYQTQAVAGDAQQIFDMPFFGVE